MIACRPVDFNYKEPAVPGGPEPREPPVELPDPARDVAEMELGELEAAIEALGRERYHARQVFRWVHQRGVATFGAMTDLSKDLRGRLAAELHVTTPRVVHRELSADGTEKVLLELADGCRIESVRIPETPRTTLCISTQVGCAVGCAFCLTGKMGLVRNLTAGEIVGQVRVLVSLRDLHQERFNIVLMGMGEPLLNYANTMKALRILADPNGLSVSPRRITLSTVGIVPGLERLASEALMPNLAISLHATTDEQRMTLVPVGRRYPLADVVEACRRFPLKRRSRITFEYVLLQGVNDSPEDAKRLVHVLSSVRAKVNLIPLNEAPAIPFTRPPDAQVDRFAQILADHWLTVSVRKSRGRDIRAACGQLIVEGRRWSPAQRLAAAIDNV
jgi:23S rRNA (adenine2503-C2)-methyltransferase